MAQSIYTSAALGPGYTVPCFGPLELVSGPTGEVVSIASLQRWLNVAEGEEQEFIAELASAAIEHCESLINGRKQLRTAVYDLPVRHWWDWELELPLPPLQSVSWIKYRDTDGTLQTLSTDFYEVRTPARMPGRVEWITNDALPVTQTERQYPVTIRFTAGYTSATVPDRVKQAVRFLVSQWYDDRMVSKVDEAMGNTVSNLLLGEGTGGYI